MFERYTEKARRVIFFARYEASQVGSPYIESEHLLIGLLRESGHDLGRYLRPRVSIEDVRAEVAASTLRREPTSTSIDLPLSNECKRILAYAAEEAERLDHRHIGAEHLLLAILREKGSLAARLLNGHGIELEATRQAIQAEVEEQGTGRDLPSAPKRSVRSFRIVDRETSETLLDWPESPALPRVGDTVLLLGVEAAAEQYYRVEDVIWEFIRDADPPRLRGLLIKVAKQAGGSSGKGSSRS